MAMAPARILIVEDDTAIRNLILRFLGAKDYQVQGAENGESALAIFEQFHPQLVILDVNLPDALGYNLCEQMQSRTNVSILMLTSRTDTEDKKEGFLKGADDYLTKPFDLEELELRVRAVLKRQGPLPARNNSALIFDNLTVDPVSREVKLNQELIPLTSLEFDLLYCLATQPGRVWKRSELIEKVWEEDYIGDRRVVDVHIGQIRKKLESNSSEPSFIQTVRGVGYKFISPAP